MPSSMLNTKMRRLWDGFDIGSTSGVTKTAAIARGVLMLSVLFALVLIAAHPAQGCYYNAPYYVLYNFCSQPNCTDGAYPMYNLTADSAGNFYGTTYGGGAWGYGTIFELSPNGNGGWNETVLYSFTGGADGSRPWGPVIFDSAGNLYGPVAYGGAYGDGVVFELSPGPTGWTYTVLYTFTGGSDGKYPWNALVLDPTGNLYGVAASGPIFKLSPAPGGWTEETVYTGSYPVGVTMDGDGNIFGNTASTVFELVPNGNGGWTPTVLYTFCVRKNDGCTLSGPPVFNGGSIYGVTAYGGMWALGTAYALSPPAGGKKKEEWTEVHYSFTGQTRRGVGGAIPVGGVTSNTLGGVTTAFGGKHNSGTVTLMSLYPHRRRFAENFHSFFLPTGIEPLASLISDSAQNLYGTTELGGSGVDCGNQGCGVVFELALY